VKSVTIDSLVAEFARSRVGRADGFRFCPEPSCDVAYYRPETGDRFLRSDVRVRIGQKETAPPRTVCYCFDHTVEEIENEVAQTGASRVAERIAEKCRQGLDRCEESNPQGSCCLGNVRRVMKEARMAMKRSPAASVGANQESKEIEEDCCAMKSKNPSPAASRPNAGSIAQVGALTSAVISSTCCWLPLLLLTFGISGGAVAAAFEPWRPVLLPLTFALLSAAFYLTYKKPKAPATAGIPSSTSDQARRAAPGREADPACCPPDGGQGLTIRKFNKSALWVVTAFVLAFAFFPNYAGRVLGGGRDSLAGRDDLEKVVVQIDGMTCEACAVSIEKSLLSIPGVAAAEVNYAKGEAIVGVASGAEAPREAILGAVASAGDFTGRFVNQVRWKLAIQGMTCESCATSLSATLAKLPDVSGVSVNYERKEAEIVAGATLTEDRLRQAVTDAGFGVASAIGQSMDAGDAGGNQNSDGDRPRPVRQLRKAPVGK
jgi:copper chaperone CopZ